MSPPYHPQGTESCHAAWIKLERVAELDAQQLLSSTSAAAFSEPMPRCRDGRDRWGMLAVSVL
jgi:hypothetical protein